MFREHFLPYLDPEMIIKFSHLSSQFNRIVDFNKHNPSRPLPYLDNLMTQQVPIDRYNFIRKNMLKIDEAKDLTV